MKHPSLFNSNFQKKGKTMKKNDFSKLLGIKFPPKGEILSTGQKLENIMKYLRISNSDMAWYLDVSDAMIIHYINNRHEMRFSKIEKLGKLGKRVLLYMFGYEEEPFVGLTAISAAKDIVLKGTK